MGGTDSEGGHSGTLPFARDQSVSGSSRGVAELPREEQSIYNEASAFEGAAIVSMIERPADKNGEVEKALEITMEDGITLTVELDSGEKRLIELGYKQELKRVLNAGQLYAVAISTMSVFAGVVPTYGSGFANGGPVALVWYWWISVFFVHLVGLSFAEISSSFPTAGSLYFWAAALAGPRLAPISSFFTGWLEFIGLSVGLSGVAYAGAHGILAPLIYMSTGYEISKYVILGMVFAEVVICAIINLFPIMVVANIMVVSAVWQIVGGIAVIIVLVTIPPTLQPASWVFGYHMNYAPTPSDAFSFVIALIVGQYSLYGYDGVAHLAEETKRSDRTGPMAIMASISTISLLGWGLIVAATFAIQDISHILEGQPNAPGAPYLQIIWDVFAARYEGYQGPGPQMLSFVIYGSFFFGCIAGLIGASRVCFSLARDDGFPLSSLWKKVSSSTGVPVNAVILSISIGFAFLLPLLANPVIYYAINSIASIGWVGAYSVPIYFRLMQKESEFCPGPFYMADYIGVIGGKVVHFVAFLWVLYTVVAFCMPTYFPITQDSFNWAPVAIITCLIFLCIWWVVDARFWFRGPLKSQNPGDDMDDNIGDVQKEGEVEVDFFES